MSLPSVAEIESTMLTAWPALQVAHDNLWIARFARGYTHRANSIQCLDPRDGGDALSRVARMTELYTRHGLPATFRVTPLAAPEISTALDVLNWRSFDTSHVLRMELHPRLPQPHHHTALFDPRDRAWHLTQAEMSGYDARKIETLKLVLAAVACDNRGVLAYDRNGVPAAAVLASVANGIGIFVNVIARESHRGQGYGRAAMQAALNWTRDAGATRAAIQVAADNPVAIKLYTSLGLAHTYDYHYRQPVRA
jgi:GNAT superfamily N-acetyltransferase